MNTLTLKIPESLHSALKAASEQRQISKSAVVREALEKVFTDELKQTGPAASWVARWRGVLSGKKSTKPTDERVAHILSKHLS